MLISWRGISVATCQAALNASEPVHYLIACLLIAEARDKLGGRSDSTPWPRDGENS